MTKNEKTRRVHKELADLMRDRELLNEKINEQHALLLTSYRRDAETMAEALGGLARGAGAEIEPYDDGEDLLLTLRDGGDRVSVRINRAHALEGPVPQRCVEVHLLESETWVRFDGDMPTGHTVWTVVAALL